MSTDENQSRASNWTDEQLQQARDQIDNELQRRGNTAAARTEFERKVSKMSDGQFRKLEADLR